MKIAMRMKTLSKIMWVVLLLILVFILIMTYLTNISIDKKLSKKEILKL